MLTPVWLNLRERVSPEKLFELLKLELRGFDFGCEFIEKEAELDFMSFCCLSTRVEWQ